jgi:hypothetical protein
MPGSSPEQQQPRTSVTERSLIGSVASGALIGSVVGIWLLKNNERAQTESIGFVWLGLYIFAGAVIGFELYRTRSWTRFGRTGRVARWVLAFVSAAAGLFPPLSAQGTVPSDTLWLMLVCGAGVGLGVGLRMEPNTAPPNEEL